MPPCLVQGPARDADPAGRGRTRAASVFERLRADILECRLRPGTHLRFEELRAAYGTGLSPLREALMRLAADGLVVLEEHKGFHVAPVSRKELADITFVRREIEATAVRRAIELGGDDWESEIVARFHGLQRRAKLRPEDGLIDGAWEERHRAFHYALAAACGSPWLLHFRGLLYDQADRYRRLSVQYLSAPRDDLGEHRAIMEAVLARDAAAAVFLVQRHIETTTRIVLAGDSSLFED